MTSRPADVLRCLPLLALLLLPASRAGAQNTPLPALLDGPPREAPGAAFDQQHLDLDLRLDVEAGQVRGTAALYLDRLDGRADTLRLDAAGLAVDSVRLALPDSAFAPVSFLHEQDRLLIPLDSSVTEAFVAEVSYSARPAYGLHLRAEPGRPAAWTDGLPGSACFWIPLLDDPGDRLTARLRFTVPPGLRLAASGRRTGEEPSPDSLRTVSFSIEDPLAPHHLGVVAGVHEATTETVRLPGGASVDLATWIYPEHTGDAVRTFGRAAAMLRFFAGYLGVPPPTEQIALAVVPSTLLAEGSVAGIVLFEHAAVVDARGALTDDPDPALARALARQWTGIRTTPGWWTDDWITEGLAAYLAARYLLEARGDAAFEDALHALGEAYLAEARTYRRPLVWDRWDDPLRLRDAHAASKGARVFHLLHQRLGDDAFRDGLRRFLTAAAFEPATTQDLQHAFEAASGTSLSAFFELWTRGAGHPALALRYEHDPDAGTLTFFAEQTQQGARVPLVFPLRLPITVHALTDTARFALPLEEQAQELTVLFASRPRFVAADPDAALLAEITVEQDVRAWVAQLRHAPSAAARHAAAQALANFADDPALGLALRNALHEEAHTGVRRALARTLGGLPPSEAVERALREAVVEEPDARTRAVLLDALAAYPGSAVHALAMDRAQHDESYAVQAAAVSLLARTNAPTALDVVRSALITPSHREIIRRTALGALTHLDLPSGDALDLALPYASSTHPAAVRAAAVAFLSTLAPRERRALDRIARSLEDPEASVRRAAIRALAAVGTPAARAALAARRDAEPVPLLRSTIDAVLQGVPLP